MTHAYPQMKYFAFRNVQKIYTVIIDNACDPKILSTLLLYVSKISVNLCSLKLKFVWGIFEMFKNVMLSSLTIYGIPKLCLFLGISNRFWKILCWDHWQCMWSHYFIRFAPSLTVSEISAKLCVWNFFSKFYFISIAAILNFVSKKYFNSLFS